MKPDWLKVKIPSGGKILFFTRGRRHTICQEAKCPNMAECWDKGTASFLILGDTCTRNCGYCNVKHGKPSSIDIEEPEKITEIVKKLGLNYVVITSVTRDDMPDGGASVFHETIKRIKDFDSNVNVEVLTPDFKGKDNCISMVLGAKPDVFAHNIEVTSDLFNSIRPQGNYERSLEFLKMIKEINPNQKTKSSLMIGLGESKDDIIKSMRDLIAVGVDFFTIGQYLQPRKDLAEVKKYYTPEEFNEFKQIGLKLGFKHVEAGPLVRSSYHAEEAL